MTRRCCCIGIGGNRNDTKALDQLLAMEGSEALQTHELQFALATYYAKEDQTQGVNAFI